MKNNIFKIPVEKNEKIVKSLNSYLVSNGYIVQKFLKYDGLVLQIKKGGGFKTFVGLATSLNVNIDFGEGYFTISFSESKWLDKGCAAFIGAFFVWPLFITSAVGAYHQMDLPDKIRGYIRGEVSKFYNG